MTAPTITTAEIKRLIAEYVRQAVNDSEERLALETGFNSPDYIDNQVELADDFKAEYQEALASNDFRPAYNSVNRLIKSKGLNITKGSETYRNLCYEMMIAKVQFMEIEKQQALGDYSYRDKLRTSSTEPVSEPEGSITLAELAQEYWSENNSNWKPRTVTEYTVMQEFLLKFIGAETLVNRVSYQMGRDYLAACKKKKNPNTGKTLSDSRVNTYVGYASAVFNFAKRHNHIKDNPFQGLQIKGKKVRPDKMRDIFSTKDLKLMFCKSQEYGQDTCLHPQRFWVPLLGLFTGCRIDELCQLRVSDIRTEDDIYYIDINEDQKQKSVKSSEARQVPLHPFIIDDLHFPEYVRSLNPKGMLFPQLKYVKNRWGHSVSQWFGRFKKKAGVVAPPNTKVFHSFRHNLSTNLKYNMVPTEMIDEITGHATQGEQSRYGKRYTVKHLFEKAILKLDYGIDLSHLKKSKYIIKK